MRVPADVTVWHKMSYMRQCKVYDAIEKDRKRKSSLTSPPPNKRPRGPYFPQAFGGQDLDGKVVPANKAEWEELGDEEAQFFRDAVSVAKRKARVAQPRQPRRKMGSTQHTELRAAAGHHDSADENDEAGDAKQRAAKQQAS